MDELVQSATRLDIELERKRDSGHAPAYPEVIVNIKNYLYDVLVRQIAIFHRKFAVDSYHIDLIVDRADIDQAHGAGHGLHHF
jgi:hypothetical protein